MDDPALERAIAAARPAARAREAVLVSVRRRLFSRTSQPDTIDRYVIERKLGAGGMGVVWAARDPRLDRKVALKLLHADSDVDHRVRLLREAQALARLTHPNVVEIYDVGAHGDRVYIAMELVDGCTLASWLSARPRRWRDVLDVFMAAGRGLQAAHAVDLVHRDFKPQNVMVSADPREAHAFGRVRVMDFGLAQGVPGSTDDCESPARETDNAPWLAAALTSTGQRVGTPAYMAPEQHDGLAVDARTDQFGFCAALYEGLVRVAPFRAPSLSRLAADKRAGRIAAPPEGHGVPSAVLAVVRRGLAADPTDRYPSMVVLLAELQRAAQLGARRKRIVLALGAGTGLVLLAANVGGAPACEDADAIRRSMWNDQRRSGVTAAFDRVDAGWAADAQARTLATLDEHGVAWARASVEACETFAVGTADRERAQDCLQRVRQRFAALVDGFIAGDADMLRHAVEASLRLPSPATCVQPDALAIAAPPPHEGELAARVEHAREQLAEVWVFQNVGRYDAARGIAEALLHEPVMREHLPLRAEVEFALGSVLVEAGEHAGAEDALARAYFDALDCGESRIAAEAATMLVFVVGAYGARHDDAFDWARHAEAALALVPDQAALHAELSINVGVVHNARGENGLAQARFREAMAMLAEQPRGQDLASAMQYLAISYLEEGRYDEARELLTRVVETRERALGAEHVLVATARVNLANAMTRAGDLEGALAEHQRALAIEEIVYGPQHAEVGVERNNLGSVLDALGEPERAHDEHARALAVFEATLGEDHPYVGATLVNLGRIDVRLGRFDRAEIELERARTVLERVLGGAHPHVAYALLGLGELEVAREHPGRALALLERANAACPGLEPILCAEIEFASARAQVAAGAVTAGQRAAVHAREQAGTGAAADELRQRIDAWSAG